MKLDLDALKLSIFVAACIVTSAPSFAEDDCTFAAPANIAIEKELMITDMSVVENARATGMGPWSFGGLMSAIAPSPKDAPQLVKNWLRTWETETSINGFVTPARKGGVNKIISKWMRKDGASSTESWVPKLENAPFRLLAIVHRPDLGIFSTTGGTTIASAGEGRFIFGLVDGNSAPPMTVIFEYGLIAKDRGDIKTWAERWHALWSISFGESFNVALQQITDRFSGRGSDPSKPNGNSLNQLRTNEIFLDNPWQLREFHLDAKLGLVNAPTKNAPHDTLRNNSDELSASLNTNAGANNRQSIPVELRFLGFDSTVVDNKFVWPMMKIKSNDIRHEFAVNTCNGCHNRETGRKADTNTTGNNDVDNEGFGFLHVGNRNAGQVAKLSLFLTGGTVRDPVDPAKNRTFCDLKIRQKAMVEAMTPQTMILNTFAVPNDLSVAQSRRNRTD